MRPTSRLIWNQITQCPRRRHKGVCPKSRSRWQMIWDKWTQPFSTIKHTASRVISLPRRATRAIRRSIRKDTATLAARTWQMPRPLLWLASLSPTRASTRHPNSAPTMMAAMELIHLCLCNKHLMQAWISTIIVPKSRSIRSSSTINRYKFITTSMDMPRRTLHLLTTIRPVDSVKCSWARQLLSRVSPLYLCSTQATCPHRGLQPHRTWSSATCWTIRIS